jgi:hypothetical protein
MEEYAARGGNQMRGEMTDFAKAREIMGKAIAEDDSLRLTYESNVAMRLHDQHGITGFRERNLAAADVLSLIFGYSLMEPVVKPELTEELREELVQGGVFSPEAQIRRINPEDLKEVE